MDELTMYSSSVVKENKPQTIEPELPTNVESETSTEKNIVESSSSLSTYYSAVVNDIQSNIKNEFVDAFLRSINDSYYEYGFSSQAEDYVVKSLKEIGPFAREWINDIFIKNFSNDFIISSILRIISHLDYNDINPQGMTMATSALLHKSIEVKENAIRAFENWENKDCLTILENISFDEVWLKKYVDQVISFLKDDN